MNYEEHDEDIWGTHSLLDAHLEAHDAWLARIDKDNSPSGAELEDAIELHNVIGNCDFTLEDAVAQVMYSRWIGNYLGETYEECTLPF